MRMLALILGAAAAVGFATAVSADPLPDPIKLAQARESGAQSGSSMGAGQRETSGSRESGDRGSQSGASPGRDSGGGKATVKSKTQRLEQDVGSHALRGHPRVGSRR